MRPTFLEWNDSAVHHGQFETWKKARARFLFDDMLTSSRTFTLELVEPHQRFGSGMRINTRTESGHSEKNYK